MGCGGSKTEVVATEPVGNGANGYHTHHNNNAKSSKTPSSSASTTGAENRRDQQRKQEEIEKEKARALEEQKRQDEETKRLEEEKEQERIEEEASRGITDQQNGGTQQTSQDQPQENHLDQATEAEQQPLQEQGEQQQQPLQEQGEQQQQPLKEQEQQQQQPIKEHGEQAEEQQQNDQEQDADGQQATETAAVNNSPTSQTTRTFTVLEIVKHNQDAGWPEWLSHKGKVYDGEAFRQYFQPYVENRNDLMEQRKTQRENEGTQPEYSLYDDNNPWKDPEYTNYTKRSTWCFISLDEETKWQNHYGVFVARYHCVSEQELDLHMPPFLQGKIVAPPADVYWGNVREDVSSLRNDLLEMEKGGRGGEDGEEEEGVMSEGVKIDFLAKLTRWQNKYSVQEPPDDKPTPGQDPNERGYPLPVAPDALRPALYDGSAEDLQHDIDGEVAWRTLTAGVIEEDVMTPAYPDTLRPALYDGSAEDLKHDIDGEAAWETLPEGVVKEDVMTPQQQEVQAQRDRRSDLQDTARMGRRRQQLCDDFVQRHELDPAIVQPFMQWAQVMEEGWKQFQTLCL